MLDLKNGLMQIRDEVFQTVAQKNDFLTSPRDMVMNDDGRIVFLGSPRISRAEFTMTDWSENQLFSKLGMPAHYFKQQLYNPVAVGYVKGLVNYHLSGLKNEERWLIRAYGNTVVRAFLSDKYTRLDNDFLVNSLAHFIQNDHRVKEFYSDDRVLHIRLVFPELSVNMGKLRDGKPDIVQVGLHIMNSEVGARALTVESVLWRQVCTNGLIVRVGGEVALQQRHVFLTEHEIQGRLRDALHKCIVGGNNSIESFRAAKEEEVLKPLEIIDELAKQEKYSKEFVDNVKVSYSIERERSGDTAFTLINAFTDAAKTLKPDKKVEVEKFAGGLLSNIKRIQRLDREVINK